MIDSGGRFAGRVREVRVDRVLQPSTVGPFFNVVDYGAVLGLATVGQRTTNLTALHAARDAALAAGGGTIVVPGRLDISGTADFADLGQTTIALHGTGGLVPGAQLRYYGTLGSEAVMTLWETAGFIMRDITIEAMVTAKYGIKLGRATNATTAGKHYFERVRVVNATQISVYNHGSEENVNVHCQFQFSPIGYLLTGYEVVADPTVHGSPAVDFSTTRIDTSSVYFYDCAFGGATTARAGLICAGSQPMCFGSLAQTAQDTAEACIIIDDTMQLPCFHDVIFDNGRAPVGYKIGHYSYNLTHGGTTAIDWQNEVVISGHLSISPNNPASFIDAYNLRNSVIGPIHTSGASIPNAIHLRDANCRDNLFVMPVYGDGTMLTINDDAAPASNVVYARGKWTFLGGSIGGNDVHVRHAQLTNRLAIDGGLYIIPPTTATNILTGNVLGESASRRAIGGSAVDMWGDGSTAPDVNLYRGGANQLKTDDRFYAVDGITTKTKAGAPVDGDFQTTPADGTMVVDTTNSKLYVRIGGAWKQTTALT